ncbi:hypothetical protein V1278_001584 [Bradyrhizobium sp. AZCC 1577]
MCWIFTVPRSSFSMMDASADDPSERCRRQGNHAVLTSSHFNVSLGSKCDIAGLRMRIRFSPKIGLYRSMQPLLPRAPEAEPRRRLFSKGPHDKPSGLQVNSPPNAAQPFIPLSVLWISYSFREECMGNLLRLLVGR